MATLHTRPTDPYRQPVAASAHPHVNVPIPSGEVVLVDPRVHRADVVRRLLAVGVAPTTLLALLPTWDALIRSVVAEVEVGSATATPDAG